MIGVIDYEAGNIASVSNALHSIGVKFLVSADENRLCECDGIILPGVGAASSAMRSLNQRELVPFLQRLKMPFLGICLGMQLLFEESEEGNTKCLGIVPGVVKRFDDSAVRIPHMGWNEVEFGEQNPPAFKKGGKAYFYFAHSYYAPINDLTQATAECGVRFTAIVRKDNYFGVQFHPEKSGKTGLSLLQTFVELCESFLP